MQKRMDCDVRSMAILLRFSAYISLSYVKWLIMNDAKANRIFYLFFNNRSDNNVRS